MTPILQHPVYEHIANFTFVNNWLVCTIHYKKKQNNKKQINIWLNVNLQFQIFYHFIMKTAWTNLTSFEYKKHLLC